MHLLCKRFITVAGQLAPFFGKFERSARHAATSRTLVHKGLLVARRTEQFRVLDPTRTELKEPVLGVTT
jgi:hypothetical protein